MNENIFFQTVKINSQQKVLIEKLKQKSNNFTKH